MTKLEDYLPLDGLGGTYSEEQARQAIANAEAAASINPGDGGSTTVELGTKIDAAVMPTGGVGLLGWLSGAFKALSDIFQLLSDRIPALVGGKIPVQVSRTNRTYLEFPVTTFSSSGDNIVVTAPGLALKLFISDFKIQTNTTTVTNFLIKEGSTVIDRIKCTSEGDGIIREYEFDKELELPANTAFIVNSSNNSEFFVSGRYRVASV